MKTPSSCLSRGLPGWPLNPPLMFIPSFSPSNRWIVISCNPLGGGSCWTVKISSAVGSNRACTASWWLALETSLPLTLRIRSPIRSRIVLAATPSGMTWKKNTRNPSKNPGRHNIYKKKKKKENQTLDRQARTFDMKTPGSSAPKGTHEWSFPPTILRPSGPAPFCKITSWSACVRERKEERISQWFAVKSSPF